MGWSFCSRYGKEDKKAFIKNTIKSWENEKAKVEILKQTTLGNVVWSVAKVTRPDKTYNIILCDLLKYDKNLGWGNKSMDESGYPFRYSCPISFLKLAPVPYNEMARDWRKIVIEEHEKKKNIKTQKIEKRNEY